MQNYVEPRIGIAMFYKESAAATDGSLPTPAPVVDPNNPGGGGTVMPNSTVSLADV